MAEWRGSKLRIATIGCGRMGARTTPAMRVHGPEHMRVLSHLEAVRSLGLADRLGACDTSVEALRAAEATYELDFVSTDYRAMLEAFRPDILTIATRTPGRRVIIEAAVEAGVRGLHVEKPLCNSAAELESIRELVEGHDVLMTSGCIRRFLDVFAAAGAAFREEEMGPLRYVQIGLGFAPLMWTQFHAIDLILYYAGAARRLEWIQANLQGVEWQSEDAVANDPRVVSANLQFDDDFTGQIGQVPGNTTILGSAAHQVEIFADGRVVYRTRRANPADLYVVKEQVLLDRGFLSGTQAPLWYLAKGLTGDAVARDRVVRSRKDFLTAQKVIFAMIESDRSGGRRLEFGDYVPSLTVWGRSGSLYA